MPEAPVRSVGRPRQHTYTYDDARLVRKALARAELALRDVVRALAERPEVQQHLHRHDPGLLRAVLEPYHVQRAALRGLVNRLQPDAVEPPGDSST